MKELSPSERKPYGVLPMNPISASPRPDKVGKYLGIGLFTAGAFFLFDPFVSVLDMLPDALGYLFLLWGLYRLSDMDDRLMEAAKGMRLLAVIGLARPVALLMAFGLVSPVEQPVFILLALFTLGVLDCIVLIPMWKNLCGGLLYLGSRNDATALLDRRRRNGQPGTYNAMEKYTAYSVFFFIARECLVILPEVTVLFHEKGGVELNEASRLYDFVGLYRVVGMAVSLVLGLIWLIQTIRLFRRIKGDTPLWERLTHKYCTEVLVRHDLFAMRAVKLSLGCLIIATVCSLDLYLDGVNVIPDVFSALFLGMSLLFLRRYTGKNLPAAVTTAAYGLFAAISWILQLKGYCRITDLTNGIPEGADFDRWQNTVLLQSVSSILFLVSVLLVLRSLFGLVKRYTGVHAYGDDTDYATRRTEAIHTLIRKKLIVVAVLAAITALATLFRWGGIPALPELDMTISGADAQTVNVIDTIVTTVYQILTDGFWFIDLAIGGIWIVTLASATGEISEQMEYASMMRD